MRTLALLLLAALSIQAQPLRTLCGTRAEPHVPRAIAANAKLEANSTRREGMVLLETNDLLAPGGNALDLAGRTLFFEPLSPTRYAKRVLPLAYVEPTTQPRHRFTWPDAAAPVAHTLSFPFPFQGKTYTTVHVSPYHGLTFEPPPEPVIADFVGADLTDTLGGRAATISPLLLAPFIPWTDFGFPDVYVEDADGIARITWRNQSGINFGLDLQTELRADGSIVFSYREVRMVGWGSPAILPDLDDLLTAGNTLGDASDAADDAANARIDVRRARIFRVPNTDLLLLRIEVGASLEGDHTQPLRFRTEVQRARPWVVELHGTSSLLHREDNRPSISGSPRVRVSGSTLELLFPQDFSEGTRSVTITASTDGAQDTATATFVFPAEPPPLGVDLSAGTAELEPPFGETFALPQLDPDAVWAAVKNEHGLSDSEIDGVAIYQTFFTDILTFAGAYATVGNPQVEGIWPPGYRSDPAGPKRPNLMHMNQYRYGTNLAQKTRILMHEFGHRWLFKPVFGPEASRALAPATSHPGGHVHLPAAFEVAEEKECSVMGGAFFEEANGEYTARVRWNGYSWLELYLMGLAAPEETQPAFYLENPSAPLPGSYWPQEGTTVTATKHAVSVQQFLDAMGPRKPSVAESQRRFRVLFVLMTKPGEVVPSEDLTYFRELRPMFEDRFAKATGNRASVDTGLPVAHGPKRRAARN